MTEESTSKSTTLSPDWKYFFFSYFFSVLAIPLAGIGFIALYFVRKKHKSITYEFSDKQISSLDTKYRRNIDLVNIEKVSVRQNWLNKKFGIGTIVLQTSASEMELLGIENPGKIKTILEQAIHAQKEALKKQKENKPREPEFEPGSMDKMEYLTGLWQQGLISEEDFEKERKHFE
ncbi:MAG: PH domain-containing protein [Balneolaceae bacterium]|nr:PH domain-containing protein [Balneolaceae bacterium]